jgi:hypothetical protein
MDNTPRGEKSINLSIILRIFVEQHEKMSAFSFYPKKSLIKPKYHLTLLSLRAPKSKKGRNYNTVLR